MTKQRIALALVLALATVGCGKKKEEAGGATAAATGSATGGAAAAPTSGLAWTPEGYDKMSASCKKALACCEEIATSEGAKSAGDYNLKCSGPALWKDAECDMDLKSRVSMFEGDGKPVPAACK